MPEITKILNPDATSEAMKYDSGLFNPEDRKAAEESEVGKAIEQALEEMGDALDISETMKNKKVYEVLHINGTAYIKTPSPAGTPEGVESVKGYINRLEKSLIEVFKKLADREKELQEVNVELCKLKKRKTKRKSK